MESVVLSNVMCGQLGMLAVHHFSVSNSTAVAYPLKKDVPGTGSDEEET